RPIPTVRSERRAPRTPEGPRPVSGADRFRSKTLRLHRPPSFVRFGEEFPGQSARPQRVEMDDSHRYGVRRNERKSLVGSAGSSRSRGQKQTQGDGRDRKREISHESHFQKSFLEKS